MSNFEARAAQFGHSIDQLKAGDEIRTIRTVHSIEELKSLLHDGAPDADRAARVAHYEAAYPDLMKGSNTSVEALHLRAMAAVHADHPLSGNDKSALKKAFPVKVELVSAANPTIKTEWTLGNQSPPVAINLGTLTIEDGGYINAYATYVTFTADTVVNKSSGGSSGANYTIGIFGVDGEAGSAGTNQPAAKKGKKGSSSGTPSPGVCTGAPAATPGGPGGNGANGGAGGVGGDGHPNLSASFTFNALEGNPVYLLTRSGAGGDGGAGGNGGNGGSGGTGGDGCQSGCEGTASANGGDGGNGGNGGNGDDGGNGVNGHPISVTLGAGVDKKMLPNGGIMAQPGKGGPPGSAGKAGGGGSGGSGSGKHRSGGQQGRSGAPGNNGSPGNSGKFSGNPGIITVTNAS